MIAGFRLHPTFDGSGDAIGAEHVDESQTISASSCFARAVWEGF